MLSRSLSRYSRALPCNISNVVHRMESSQTSSAKVTSGFIEELKKIVGNGNVSTTSAMREQHGHDESYHVTSLPDAVVFAQSVDHVSKVAKLCNDNGVPLIPFGSGTGLEGGINATLGGVSLDVSQMTKIVAVNAEDFDCTVESGVTRMNLNSFLRDTGLWFPVDPGADASLCGMCSTSASGTNAVRYGTMRENVLNLEVVLADGRVIWTAGPNKRCRKTSAGYNLTNLFVGSEGTLGIITKAIIKLYGIPESIVSAVVHFPSVQGAVDTTVQILQCGIPIARLEFLDEVAIDAFNKFSKFNMKVSPSLFLEFHGSSSGVKEQVQIAEDIVKGNGGEDFKWATDPEERNRLWKARHEILYACTALCPGSKPYSTDVCVPISHLPEIILRSKEMVKEANLIVPILGHVGDGNIHSVFLIGSTSDEEFRRIKRCINTINKIAMELSGTCTGEHGIGIGKRDLLEKELGKDCLDVMKDVKLAFDPKMIMNPGKVFL
ncbi:probable D-lactate dehydrogenase, mitochondrial isoform X2 [Pomacea canaliculata]|uniref:probable D-lactate dehydrogenase, mitochondrial isoform X2 n=1 Tax=Pomacea canaliculata TaxID=400727 RepID=UPI000D73C9D4|nr:probable D-lactate dehydrogenase, mitochondrial isoform X2 [Pomacea canaliculata]